MVKKVDPVRGMWRIDLHMHTWVSPDSKTDPKALVEQAREIGLNRIAVTDHNVIEGALEAHRLAPDLVIVGQEIDDGDGRRADRLFRAGGCPAPFADSGDDSPPARAGRSDQHLTSARLAAQFGPGREARPSKIIDQVDALEVFNARCLRGADNVRAAEIAKRYGKAITAGSDAHTLREIGRGYLTLPPFRDTPQAFLDSLSKATPGGRLSGIWPHFASTFAKLGK